MNQIQVRGIMNVAKEVAAFAADRLRKDDDTINNQEVISATMLATCIMARFFNEDEELLHRLLTAMCVATEDIPCADEFQNSIQ